MTCGTKLGLVRDLRRTTRARIAGILLLSLLAGGCQQQSSESATPPATPPASAKPAAKPDAFVPPEIFLKWHFRGLQAMGADTNLTAFHEVSALPQTETLKTETVARIADFLSHSWSQESNVVLATRTFLTNVLTDLLQQETHLEVRQGDGGGLNWTLAAALNSEQAERWQTNFFQASAARGTNPPASFQFEKFAGWQSANVLPTNSATLLRAGEWTLLSNAKPEAKYGLAAEILKSGRPVLSTNEHWFEADLQPARIGPFQELASRMKLGRTHWLVASRRGALRTEGTLSFTGPNGWTLEPWQIPTNTMNDPMISFTAFRGFQSVLAQSEFYKLLDLPETPNQLFLWSQPTVFASIFGAVPMNQASNAVLKLAATGLGGLTNLLGTNIGGRFVVATNVPSIAWRDLPVGVPFVRTAPEPTPFLHFGLIPLYPTTNPPPQELLGQVTGRTNLVYYDWEVPSPRLELWPGVSQFASFAASLYLDPNKSAADEWIKAIQPKLEGNNITEIAATGPQEWQLVRRSDLGFTSGELALFMRWFNSSIFPRWGLEVWVDPALKTLPHLKKRQP